MRENHPAHELYLSGWSLLMFNFEKALYENPDQDLNKLWWDMVENTVNQKTRTPE
jgi:peptidyl-dipeptidase A